MKIGSCWLNVQEQQLLDPDSQSCWDLEPDEFEIIRYLLEWQGKVVSRLELIQVVARYHKGGRHYDRLEQIINRFSQALGDNRSSLLSKVSDQGYILHMVPIKKTASILATPFIKIEPLPFFLLLFLGFVTLCLFFSRIANPTSIAPDHAHQFTLPNNRVAEISFYTGQQKMKSMKPFAEQMVSQVSACTAFPWHSISVSISNSRKMLTIFLDDKKESTNYKIIKLISEDFNVDVFDEQWLRMVGICD
ncbi:MAG: winged helix-turn-helix domain-containing protein [Shewanella sp.]